MKFLILLTFISFNSFSATAWFPLGKDGASQNYYDKSFCEEKEGQECFNLAECPIDECVLIDEVDDLGIYTGKKLLRHSPVKKAAKEAKEKTEKDAELSSKATKKALKQSVKNDIKEANTVAKLRALVEKLIEAQE